MPKPMTAVKQEQPDEVAEPPIAKAIGSKTHSKIVDVPSNEAEGLSIAATSTAHPTGPKTRSQKTKIVEVPSNEAAGLSIAATTTGPKTRSQKTSAHKN